MLGFTRMPRVKRTITAGLVCLPRLILLLLVILHSLMPWKVRLQRCGDFYSGKLFMNQKCT